MKYKIILQPTSPSDIQKSSEAKQFTKTFFNNNFGRHNAHYEYKTSFLPIIPCTVYLPIADNLECLFAFMRLSWASFTHLILCYSFTNEWKHMQRHETLRPERTEGFIEKEMQIHCGTGEWFYKNPTDLDDVVHHLCFVIKPNNRIEAN